MTKTITIPNPKIFEYEHEMVLIPKEEYQTLTRIKVKGIQEIALMPKQKAAIAASEKEFKKGDFVTLDEFEKRLARSYFKTRR